MYLRKKSAFMVFFLTTLLMVFIVTSCGNKSLSDSQGENQGKGEIILATTTSTQDTGLLDVLIPLFEQKTGYKVKTIAVGTGQALAMGERGDADVMLVHAPEAEMELVKKGAAINRMLVMHNDFVVVGPPEDPAGIRKARSAAEAFKLIAEKQALFISRGDDSGTHKKELQIWKQAGVENPEGKWYQSTGQGMGATLDIASEKGGYTLTDRGTYLAKSDDLRLEILVEGAKELLNIYHVMQTNPEYVKKTNPNAARMINSEGAKAFVDFMVGEEAQKIIGEFGKDRFGQPLFFPDAGKDEGELLKGE
ncbi:MAG: tungstate transport system substrate-binding protein [Tepidanaerobacteraceae bacterium]|nr:tungstate transport system substrate-binding protein [Tepidanaerobacteraceae bacterium]